MVRSRIVIVAALLILGVSLRAQAQPLFTTVYDWTVDTPAGQFGYQQIRQHPGAWHSHYLVLGESGRHRIDPATFLVLGVGVLIIAALLTIRRTFAGAAHEKGRR